MLDSNSIPSNNSQRRNVFPQHRADTVSQPHPGEAGDSSASSKGTGSAMSMDEAFRRVGHRLSQRVGGVRETPRPVADLLEGQASSAFSLPSSLPLHVPSAGAQDPTMTTDASMEDSASDPQEQAFDRSPKVAKMRYSDHGSHHRPTEFGHESILKKLTQRARETYDRARHTPEEQHKSPKKRGSSDQLSHGHGSSSEGTTALSPHRQAFSELALDDGTSSTMSLEPDPTIRRAPEGDKSNKGLLEAALELKESPSPSKLRRRGKCLTSPSVAVSNDGLDNADGNLIVHLGDRIQVSPNNAAGTMKASSAASSIDFVVLGPLGQGTFAQVLKCRCVATGEVVAVKIVKNKPAYTRQAAVEIDVFRVLGEANLIEKDHMVRLQSHFVYQSHLCLVFELLGLNLYEVLKKRQFRGLPLFVVRNLVQQAMEGIKDLSQKSIVHCDIKPENILLSGDHEAEAIVNAGERPKPSSGLSAQVAATESIGPPGNSGTPSTEDTGLSTASDTSSHSFERSIKLIDFGSACFEGHTAHSYIQSRFYRSPEVLIGLPYDSAIDMWSLGCVAAELFLGLPILPGVHEHDQLGRICEMIGTMPDWMLDQGSKSTKYFAKQFDRPSDEAKPLSDVDVRQGQSSSVGLSSTSSQPPAEGSWRMKTLDEYVESMSAQELRKKGGLAKVKKQPTNRYFKRKRLADIIMLHGQSSPTTCREELGLFTHFLLGILNPDPWKRWTAYQASMHPFVTGTVSHRRRRGTGASRADASESGQSEGSVSEYDIYWVPPWDPSICRRKLLNVQKTREKQQAMRRSRGLSGQSQSLAVQGSSPNRTIQGSRRHDVDKLTEAGVSRSRIAQMGGKSGLRRQTSLPAVPLGQHNVPPGSMQNSIFPMIQQNAMGNPAYSVTPSGAMMIGGIQHSSYVPVGGAGLGQPMMVPPAALPGTHNGYGDVPVPQQVQFASGPQSYTGLSYGGVGHTPIEGELWYALQRPGVFPGMSSDVSGSLTMSQPVQVGAMGGYALHQFSSNMSGPSSYAGHPGTPGGRRRHAHSYRSGGKTGSYEYAGVPGSSSQSLHVPGGFLTSPTSIQEDATDFNLGGQHAERSMLSSSVQTSSHGSNGSLLSQQLERRSGIDGSQYEPPVQGTSQPSDRHGHGLPQYIGPGSTAFSYSGALPPGAYYSPYAATIGGGMMSAPANYTNLLSHVNYGDYVDESGGRGTTTTTFGEPAPMSLDYCNRNSYHAAAAAHGVPQGGGARAHALSGQQQQSAANSNGKPPQLSHYYHQGMSM